jgi:hypothetical protein
VCPPDEQEPARRVPHHGADASNERRPQLGHGHEG